MNPMAMAVPSPRIATFLSSSSSSFSLSTFHLNSHSCFCPRSLPSTSPILLPPKKFIFFRYPFQRNNRLTLAAVAAEDVIPSEAATADAADQLVSNPDDGVSYVVSALLFAAFIGLGVITIGVIYLAVVDLLQKREKDKFEKEEASKKGKKSKKKVGLGRGRAGPRGFGQKLVQYDDEDE